MECEFSKNTPFFFFLIDSNYFHFDIVLHVIVFLWLCMLDFTLGFVFKHFFFSLCFNLKSVGFALCSSSFA